jgi:MinD-like ATPase involved in chromosome partitioning or flagellar assembly
MSKIVSIHSFRGGTGKSNITANLAVTITGQGRQVAIIDTDIASPGIHVLFGLDEDKIHKTLNDYLWGNCGIEDTAYDVSANLRTKEDEATPTSGSIYLIPSSIKTGHITRVLKEGYNIERLNDGLRELTKKLDLDYLFIDTHPGLNDETLLSIALSDILLVILRPDEQDYQGTGITVEVARKLDVPKMLLVVNKVLSEFDFSEVKKKVEKTYSCEVAGVLPLSEEMIRLGSAGIFCIGYPDHPFTATIREIASKVM